ncbi:hypothetical protein, partial [Escherichia coli]|uniref:hypothetical protein n=1 Tax=Escherichia coli TaxID=562 RepID=UPI001C7001F4
AGKCLFADNTDTGKMREPVKSANDMKHFNFLFIYTPFVNDEREISRYYILTHNYEKIWSQLRISTVLQ